MGQKRMTYYIQQKKKIQARQVVSYGGREDKDERIKEYKNLVGGAGAVCFGSIEHLLDPVADVLTKVDQFGDSECHFLIERGDVVLVCVGGSLELEPKTGFARRLLGHGCRGCSLNLVNQRLVIAFHLVRKV